MKYYNLPRAMGVPPFMETLQELCGADAVDETSELSKASDLARCCAAGEPRWGAHKMGR